MFKVQACSAAQTFVQAQHPWQHLMALQVDAAYGDSGVIDDNPNDDLAVVDFGLSLNVGEIGKIALAHTDNKYEVTDIDNDGDSDTSETAWETKTTAIAGEVSVSDLTAYIGAQTAKNNCIGVMPGTPGEALTACPPDSETSPANTKHKTTFFGIRGGFADTGINYLFQWRNTKSNDRKPWMLGLYKGLGGRASLNLEHADTDVGTKSSTE